MSRVTLATFRSAVLADYSWRRQRGPNDTSGHDRDVETATAIRRARSWDAMCAAVPLSWQSAAANRCLPGQL